MSEESHGFENARVRLEEIVSQVRKKDVSLEKSLDLLEEGVRLANQCVEQIDHADWDAAAGLPGEADGPGEPLDADAADGSAASEVSESGEGDDSGADGPADADDEAQ